MTYAIIRIYCCIIFLYFSLLILTYLFFILFGLSTLIIICCNLNFIVKSANWVYFNSCSFIVFLSGISIFVILLHACVLSMTCLDNLKHHVNCENLFVTLYLFLTLIKPRTFYCPLFSKRWRFLHNYSSLYHNYNQVASRFTNLYLFCSRCCFLAHQSKSTYKSIWTWIMIIQFDVITCFYVS